jgi:tetratricopeptide (TPR) repeat protein
VIDQALHGRLLALFGAPIAVEDHARRAVLAALGLRRRLASRDSPAEKDGPRLEIAVATGALVVGGPGEPAVGPAITAVERLRARASSGDILLSESAREQLDDEIEAEVLEPREESEQEDEGRPVFRLVEVSWLDRRPRVPRGRLSSFVGRRNELATLHDLRERAASGGGQVVGIAGEAGAGKTRLLYELGQRLPGESVLYWSGRCLPYAEGTPYFPLRDLLHRIANISDAEPASSIVDKLRGRLRELGLDEDENLPYLAALFGVSAGSVDLSELEAQVVQSRTFAALKRMISAASRRTLLVLEIEDLHWIDATSESFLCSLVDELPALHTLLITTYRSGYRPRWMDRSYAHQITLGRLSDEESRLLMTEILEQSSLGEEQVASILEKAEGNPFFLEELAHSAREGGHGEGTEVPGTVQGVLSARMDRLPAESKRLLQVASVLGHEVSLDLLARVWDRSTPVGSLLVDLQEGELLVPVAAGARSPRFAFHHALSREVAYLSLLESQRRRLHAAAGRAIEELHREHLEDVYDHLAHHYARAGEPGTAVRYLVRFAAQAARGYAHAEAARALHEALEQARALPAEERGRTTLQILLELADSLLPLARLKETRELLERHRELPAAVDDPVLTGRFHFWLAHTCSYLGEREAADDHAKRAIEAARSGGDETTEGKAHYVLGRDAFWAGRYVDGLERSERAIVLLERSEEPWWQGQAYWVAGFHHFLLGGFDRAREALGRAESICEALDDYRLDPSWSLGYFHAALGDWELGIEQCRRGLDVVRDPLNTAAALGFLGYAYLQGGDTPRAFDSLRRSVDMLREAGMQQLLAWFQAYLAEVLLDRDEMSEAVRVQRESLESSRGADFPFGVGLAERSAGRIAAQRGELEESERRLRRALEIFRELGAPLEQAKTRLDLGHVLSATDETAGAGERDEAHRLLETLGLDIERFEDRNVEGLSASAS